MLMPFLATLSLLLAFQAQPDATKEKVVVEKTDLEAKKTDEGKSEDDEIICRNTAVTGSKITKRLCGTRAEWAQLERINKDTTAKLQRRQ